MPKGFGIRTYQQWIQADELVQFRVTIQESDLLLLAQRDLTDLARQTLIYYRSQLEQYIAQYPDFRLSLQPIPVKSGSPSIIQAMAAAAQQAEVGPFASVAGAIAEYVGKTLLPFSPELLVENGGDIFLAGTRDRIIGIYAGNSPLTGKIALKIAASQMPCGVCTSSGTVGPSLSFGKADAAVILARSTALADACATAMGNMVSTPAHIEQGLQFAAQIPGVEGAVIIVGKELGVWGNLQLVKTSSPM
ncbi:ApbE family lipoprotein [Candidatus Vecturithrix granuli]|uniref:ApbE family lipoprotein n=1 Tax=Vecturithrix granuli TaxID=1499967 RepID=A0A081BYS9_VECG1|nr:ApbE family lipoprotein [Candidatus Vecturithrix granuli]